MQLKGPWTIFLYKCLETLLYDIIKKRFISILAEAKNIEIDTKTTQNLAKTIVLEAGVYLGHLNCKN